MKRVLIFAVVILILILAAFFACKYWGTYGVVDKGVMENPFIGDDEGDYESGDIEMLDGPGEIFDWKVDLQTKWYCDEPKDRPYAVLINEHKLTLFEGNDVLLQKDYKFPDVNLA